MEKLTKEEMHHLKEKLINTKKYYERIISQQENVLDEKEKLVEAKTKITNKLKELTNKMDKRESKVNKTMRITLPSLATALGILGSVAIIKSVFAVTIITKAITFVVGAGLSLGLIAGIAKLTKDFIDEDLTKLIDRCNKPLMEQKKKVQIQNQKLKSKIRDLEENNELLDYKKKYLENRIKEIGILIRKGKKNYNSEVINELVQEQTSKAVSALKNKIKVYKK